MSPEDKKQIRDAFLRAVAQSPAADEIIPESGGLTQKEIIAAIVESDEYYDAVEEQIKGGVFESLDDFIEQNVKGILGTTPAP
jgi:hypothetical protein